MRKCPECQGTMKEKIAKTPESVDYSYYRCESCGEEIVNLQQLHEVAEKYRTMKTYHAKLSTWGFSLGLRIPKDLIKKYRFKNEEEVVIIPEKKGLRIIPA